ncbi:hypothetical protein ACI5KX_12500 [Erythrobacter sp. GH1-10]|uniref:hypothetical protein n=1 Tax=Erythrobacter sp. GH1-10 TaxID=3349334 RepID=UPI0038780CB7
MIYILQNIVPIATAMLAGLAIGIVWLRVSAILLPGLQALALAAIAEFWLASILAGALILAPPEAGEWTMALGSAFVIWIGFVLPVLAVTFMVYEMKTRAVLSAALHWLVVMLVQATIMQAIGLTGP